MTCDDIYFAATQGEVEKLREMLSTDEGKAILKQTMVTDCGGDWDTSEFTVVFSILNEMQGNMNREVLDVLAECGVDFNERVILRNSRVSRERPLLEFPVAVWNNKAMAEYMLKKGASADADNIFRRADGRIERTTMLYFAICEAEDPGMMELLLKYGADPDKCCEVYNEELGVYQYLPPLFYSMVTEEDYRKTVDLMRYGASPQCGIDVGKGISHNTNFKKYLSINYPGLSNELVSAFEEASENPAKAVKAPAKKQEAMSEQEVQERRRSGTLDHKLNSGSKVNSLRRCYGKFTAYCVGNFGTLALALCVIGPLACMGNDKELAGALFCTGLPFALIVAAIFAGVNKKAKKRGQDGIMLQLVKDGILMMGVTILLMSIILIPFALSITRNVQWEERRTASGQRVMVKKTGDGTYEDASGRQYVGDDD